MKTSWQEEYDHREPEEGRNKIKERILSLADCLGIVEPLNLDQELEPILQHLEELYEEDKGNTED